MNVCVTVHLDIAEDGGAPIFVWWAESADLEGFYAAAPTLAELEARCESALRELLPEERGEQLELLGFELAGQVESIAPASVEGPRLDATAVPLMPTVGARLRTSQMLLQNTAA
jgi:predicted RNase H-like HicB family nuclease